MRFLQKFGFRLQWIFLALCWTCAFASIKINDNCLSIIAVVFASISILGWCIESAASNALKEAERESRVIKEMLDKCFIKNDDEKK